VSTPAESRFDVCVVGAGPAGATIGNRLARLGYRVLLLDGSVSSCEPAWESLPPAILPLLDELGARDDFERAAFPPVDSVRLHWADEDSLRGDDAPGSLVDRSVFDAVLRRAAEGAGAVVRRNANVRRVRRRRPFDWRISVRSDSSCDRVACRFLVDAAGRRGLLPAGRVRLSPPTLALSARLRGRPTVDARMFVEAGRDEWFWGAVLGPEEFVAMVFLDPGRCREAVDLDETYDRSLALSRWLGTGRRTTRVDARSASITYVRDPAGADWLKVGDAAVAFDPISSQGVLAAVAGGLQAAAVVNTLLQVSASPEVAIRFHRERVREKALAAVANAAEHYRRQADCSPTPFWRCRGADAAKDAKRRIAPPNLDVVVRVASEVTIRPAGALVGDAVVEVPAVTHPALSGPVAWLGRRHLAALVAAIDRPLTIGSVMQRWAGLTSRHEALQLFTWFWERGLLVAEGVVETNDPSFAAPP
jgi:2-polyprenyl-6-methoxyphenol hydroxylase-like FAD-dependent oxidoreductase